jgi:hypothetical protein
MKSMVEGTANSNAANENNVRTITGTKSSGFGILTMAVGSILILGSLYFLFTQLDDITSGIVIFLFAIATMGVLLLVGGLYVLIVMKFVINQEKITIKRKFGKVTIIKWSDIQMIQIDRPPKIIDVNARWTWGTEYLLSLRFIGKDNKCIIVIDNQFGDIDCNALTQLIQSIHELAQLKNIKVQE